MLARFMMIFTMFGVTAMAGIRSGKAEVDWIGESTTCEAGKPMQTAIRMIHDPGWHSYWINPGEAGMPTTIEWKLPPGWQTSGLRYPSPIRFNSGDLAGFGYEGTILFPVVLTPPEDFSGNATLQATIKWLTCSDDGCVPGKAEVSLEVRAGSPEPGPDAAIIRAAAPSLPSPPTDDGPRLKVTEGKDSLVLEITPPSGDTRDFGQDEVFPITADAIDPASPIRFEKTGEQWRATVRKSDYINSPLRRLSILLVAKGTQGPPIEVEWSAP